MDKRTRYIKERLPAYWEEKNRFYGFTDYHQAVLQLLGNTIEHSRQGNRRLLECAAGTGWPLATGGRVLE
jgi:hypothetical protein